MTYSVRNQNLLFRATCDCLFQLPRSWQEKCTLAPIYPKLHQCEWRGELGLLVKVSWSRLSQVGDKMMLWDSWRCKAPGCISPSLLSQGVPSWGLLRSCLAVSWCITTFPRQGIALQSQMSQDLLLQKGNCSMNSTIPLPFGALSTWAHGADGELTLFFHRVNMYVTHLNKYGDVLWDGQDVSGKVCPSLFSHF